MFWHNFILLCKEKRVSPTSVCKALGFSTTLVSRWKNGSVPRDTTLLRISEFFDVPVSALTGDAQKEEKTPPKLYPLEQDRIHMIPLFESVSAGFGALAVNEIVDYIPWHFKNPSEAEQTIFIKVHGNSMAPKIEDGDIIQVHKQEDVDSGSIAVVMIDDNGLVKRVVYGASWLELHSINPMYKPMRFNGPDVERVRVVGLVKRISKEV